MSSLLDVLIETARRVLVNAYAPYSGVRVACAVETDRGIFYGVNVENASYGLTICAERSAVASAVAHGARKIKRVVVLSDDVVPYPCGACRQVIAEFATDDCEVIVVHRGEIVLRKLIWELLPHTFKLRGAQQ